MLSQTHARRAAQLLVDRYGEVAIAAAMLRAQEALKHGRAIEHVNWRRIASAAARRLQVD